MQWLLQDEPLCNIQLWLIVGLIHSAETFSIHIVLPILRTWGISVVGVIRGFGGCNQRR